GLDVMGESPLLFKWEWISDPLDCPPNETCKPEPMVGTTSPLDGNPRPFQGGEEVRLSTLVAKSSRKVCLEDPLPYLPLTPWDGYI
ncbi:hypothetical protein, partial [Sulfodiicoccus acidiphilus]